MSVDMSKLEDLERLAETCLATAKTIKNYLALHGHPPPSFDQNGPLMWPNMDREAEYARVQLRDASKTLYELASGPDDILCQNLFNCNHDINAFRYVYHFKIHHAVPLDSTISYIDLARTTKTNVQQLQKMIRQLTTINVFSEPKKGYVSHTAASKLLTINPALEASNAWYTMDMYPWVQHQIPALEKFGHGSPEHTETALNMSFNDFSKPMFTIFEDHPETRARFSKLMTHVSTFEIFANRHVQAGFDWSSLPSDAVVVDIGGNAGHCSLAIAESHPTLKCIVQDLPATVEQATNPRTTIIPANMQNRISFMEHNFFAPQPIKNADVYFLRMIMHDYSDKYARLILQQIFDVMKRDGPRKSKIVIMDTVMPDAGTVPKVIERVARTMDTMMMLILNATERDRSQWDELMDGVHGGAHGRGSGSGSGSSGSSGGKLQVKNVILPEGSLMACLEVEWVGDNTKQSTNKREGSRNARLHKL